jgi:GT2 family glycosyltransferase
VEDQRSALDVEIVVVTPDDATEAIDLAHRHGAKVVSDPRRGISVASNLGIESSESPWFTWLGDDDLLRPGALACLVDLTAGPSKPVVAFGACDYIDEQGTVLFVSRAGALAWRIQRWGPNLVPLPSSLFNARAVAEVGLFDPDLRYSMDLDLFLRLRRVGGFVATKTSVAAFRWHPASTTVSARDASSREAAAVRKRHLPVALRGVSPLWEGPVRLASRFAAGRVNAKARSVMRP